MSVAEAGRGSRPSRPGELHRRRVLLVADSAGLAAVLGHLLGPTDRLSHLGSLRELPDSQALEDADVVVLDLPDGDRAAAVGQVRRRYRGPLVVLAGEGEDPGGPALDDACTVLARPFSVEELGAALARPGRPRTRPPAATPTPPRPAATVPPPTRPAATAAPAPGPWATARPWATAGRRRPADRWATARPRPTTSRRLADRAQGLLVALVEGWQAQRQVRVAGFAALAVLAFAVAFVLAAQGRCGPGCERLGTGLSPAPSLTTVGSRAAPSTAPRHPTSTTTIRVGPGGSGAFLGTSERRRAAATTASGRAEAATTTTREPATTRPATSRPATTRPATTQSTAPTTTEPVTTEPVTTTTAAAP